MALITCPECGRKISDQASACPQCGYPIPVNAAASRYAIVVVSTAKPTALLAKVLWGNIGLGEEEAADRVASLPSLVARDLEWEQATELVRQLQEAGAVVKLIDNKDARDLESAMLADSAPLPGQSRAQPPREPLSFGGVVGAVVVGILAVVLILSFL